jgi:hypothetical protein
MKNTPGSRRTTSAAVVHATDTGHRYESRDSGSPLPTLATLLYDITDDIFEVGRLVVLREARIACCTSSISPLAKVASRLRTLACSGFVTRMNRSRSVNAHTLESFAWVNIAPGESAGKPEFLAAAAGRSTNLGRLYCLIQAIGCGGLAHCLRPIYPPSPGSSSIARRPPSGERSRVSVPR